MSEEDRKPKKPWGLSTRRRFNAALGVSVVAGCTPLLPTRDDASPGVDALGMDASVVDAPAADTSPDVPVPPPVVVVELPPPTDLPSVLVARPLPDIAFQFPEMFGERDGNVYEETLPLAGGGATRFWVGSLERSLQVTITPDASVVYFFHPYYGMNRATPDEFRAGVLHQEVREHIGDAVLYQAIGHLGSAA